MPFLCCPVLSKKGSGEGSFIIIPRRVRIKIIGAFKAQTLIPSQQESIHLLPSKVALSSRSTAWATEGILNFVVAVFLKKIFFFKKIKLFLMTYFYSMQYSQNVILTCYPWTTTINKMLCSFFVLSFGTKSDVYLIHTALLSLDWPQFKYSIATRGWCVS